MKKLLLLLFVHLIFFSGESKKEGIDAIPEKEERNSILWKIEKDDQISYLFGTTHIMCEDQMKYKDILDALVKEVDVSHANVVPEADGVTILNFVLCGFEWWFDFDRWLVKIYIK